MDLDGFVRDNPDLIQSTARQIINELVPHLADPKSASKQAFSCMVYAFEATKSLLALSIIQRMQTKGTKVALKSNDMAIDLTWAAHNANLLSLELQLLR